MSARQPLTARFAPAWSRAQARWRQLSARERVLCIGMAVVLALLLLWRVGWEPAWARYEQAQLRQPVLERESLQLSQVLEDITTLKGDTTLATGAGEITAAAIQATLNGHGLSAASITPQAGAQPPRWLLQLEAVPATALLAWVQAAPGLLPVRIQALDLAPPQDERGHPTADRLSGTLLLAPREGR